MPGIRNEWDSRAINDLTDSYYQEWTYEDRKLLEYTCQAGFLFSVVIVQWACVVQARSRRLSVLQRPLNNWVLNFSLIFETILAFLIIYIPGSSEVCKDFRYQQLLSTCFHRVFSWHLSPHFGGYQGSPSPLS